MSSAKRPRNVLVVSLGCAKNLVDTEVMCGSLAVGGYTLTNIPEEADIMLLNTCSFIADARAEAENEIAEALRWRRQGRNRRVVVAGCLPQRDLVGTAARFRGVDLFMGLDDVPRAAELFDQLYAADSTPAPSPAPGDPSYIYDSRAPRLQLTPRNYAYVKIAEGCDHKCTFCSIPAIRGRQRSRPVNDIVNECSLLLDGGVRELNFIAQDTSRFGHDRDDGAKLTDLVAACEREIAGNYWIRILYTHPRYFDDDLLTAYIESTHLVPYIDMPLQHISSPVLKHMGRRIDEQETRQLLERIRRRLPQVAIRTTFLVGFPGETEADFQLLESFVREFQFDRLGVFAYSPEEGTPAAKLSEGVVPPRVAASRRDELMAVQREISREKNKQLVGTTVTVLVEGIDAAGNFIGRTFADAPEVDNLVTFSGPDDALDMGFVDVKVTAASEYDLVGEVIPVE